jgi:hypothetical protein
MEYNFEWFNPTVGTPIVTLGEYGLGFNKAAIEALKSPARVRLGYDKKHKVIAVMPAGEDDKAALPFASKERNGYIRVSTKDFARFIMRYNPELKLDKAIRCLAWVDGKTGALLADLSRPIDSEMEGNDEV